MFLAVQPTGYYNIQNIQLCNPQAIILYITPSCATHMGTGDPTMRRVSDSRVHSFAMS